MDTKDLRCFCRVYEERGINQAAKQLFISPQGLSRIITKLEAELQVTLFCRSARGLSPTASGTYLYENGRELLNRLEELEIGIRRMERIDRELQLGFSCGVLNVFPFQQLDQFMPYGFLPAWKHGAANPTGTWWPCGSGENTAWTLSRIRTETGSSGTLPLP